MHEKKTALLTVWPLFVALAAATAGVANPRHCFNTNGVEICHDRRDESVFFDTPTNQVAYNVQVIHRGDDFFVIYHGEQKGAPRPADAIKTGVIHGAYAFQMPLSGYQLWGPTDDPRSLLDSDGVGGAGNPMAISGLPGDPYFYVFFLGVSDDDRKRDFTAGDWRHYLLQARTKDFLSFELRTDDGWIPFTEKVRPALLKDTLGNEIRSNTGRSFDKTQGLIGSISLVSGAYHYFYFDYTSDGRSVALFHRTSRNVGKDLWSPPETVLTMPQIGMVRVAKAKNMDRWAIMYNCYVAEIQDVCMQYTKSLRVVGPGGISEAHLTADYALGFSRDGKAKSYSQPYWLTDQYGNLDTVGSDTGGEMYWTDMTPSNCIAHQYPYCPVYGGIVYRAGWTASLLHPRSK